MTKQIALTQGQVAIVDDWRYDELNHWKWQAHYDPRTKSYRAARMEGRPQKRIYMSRQIMNTPDDQECDHANHNTLDNQEHNLRNATHVNNSQNRMMFSNNKS